MNCENSDARAPVTILESWRACLIGQGREKSVSFAKLFQGRIKTKLGLMLQQKWAYFFLGNRHRVMHVNDVIPLTAQ
jgi:hypothetical protein